MTGRGARGRDRKAAPAVAAPALGGRGWGEPTASAAIQPKRAWSFGALSVTDPREQRAPVEASRPGLGSVVQRMTAKATKTAFEQASWTATNYYYIKDVTWNGKVGTALLGIPAHITVSRSDVEDVDAYTSFDDIKSDYNLRWHVTADVDDYGSKDNIRFFYTGSNMSWNYTPNDDNWTKWTGLGGTESQVNGLLAAALDTW